MKKAIVIVCVVAVCGGALVQRNAPVQEVAAKIFKPVPPPAMVLDEKPATAAQANVDLVAQALAKAEALDTIEHRYIDEDAGTWVKQLAESQKRVQVRGLVAKSTRGTLTDEEAVALVTEIRRQHVLATLLTKEKVEQLKRRYL